MTVHAKLFSKTGDTTWQAPRLDPTTHAIITVDHATGDAHEGNYFYVKGWMDIANAGTHLDFLWVVASTTKWPHANWNLSAEAEFIMTMYEDVSTSNNGTPITIHNSNRNSSTAAGVLGFTGPTLTSGTLGDGSNGGTEVWAAIVGSGKDATVGKTTGYGFIGKQGSKYWFRLTHVPAGTHWIDFDFNWSEQTNKAP